jgi:hypothetical protein
LQWVDILGSQLHRARLAADGGPDRVRTIADRSVRRGGRTPSWEAETCSLRAWGFCR